MIFFAWLLIDLSLSTASAMIAPLPAYNPSVIPRKERMIVLLWYSVPFSWWLDQREPSIGQFGAGFVIYVLGVALLTAAKLANPHFRPEVVMPPKVIRSGPYKYLNHPGYWAFVMMGAASLLMLGHIIGWFLLGVYGLILMLRAREEDWLLAALQAQQESLDGEGIAPSADRQSVARFH